MQSNAELAGHDRGRGGAKNPFFKKVHESQRQYASLA
jgi:hypothetical protein